MFSWLERYNEGRGSREIQSILICLQYSKHFNICDTSQIIMIYVALYLWFCLCGRDYFSYNIKEASEVHRIMQCDAEVQKPDPEDRLSGSNSGI